MPKRLRWKTAHCNVTSYSASPRKRVQQKKHYSQTRQCSQFVGKKFPAFTRDQEVHDEAPSDHAAGVSYKSRLTKEKEAWKTLRQDLTRVFQEEAAPMTFHCQTCKEQCSNVIVCSDCHGLTHFCELCVEKAHENIMFHRGKQWKDTYFTPYKIGLKRTWSTGCLCSDPYTKQLTVVDFRGQLNTILFQFCSCEPECCSLLRFGLWGMSPTDPKVAIDVNLLKLLSALQLECHISTKGFWNTLQSLNMELIEEKKKYYRLLISESMHEFRAFQWKLKTLEDIVPNADKGTTCPACPVGEGTAVISIDANFGLVRKKKKDGIYELSDMNHYFLDQSEVDTFVSSYADGKNERDDANCSNFHAGNKVRSKASSKRLDVTGVFGASCRHEIPLLFLDMRHGERLAYPVFLLKEILHKYNGVNLFLMYDIACLLSSHLKKTKQTEVLSSMSLAVPVFHAYGHKASCQVLYNPRRVPGIGLSDGEVMERLWSYLRSFSKVTKEMTVSHRHDLLSHALLHFSAQKCQNIGASTVVRLKKANSVYSDASQQLSNLQAEASTLHLITEEKEILKWIDEEKKVHQTKASRAYKTTWKEDYVKDLKAMHAIRSTFQQLDDVDNMVEYTKKVHQLNLKLLEVERKHHIAERWTASSQLFQTVEKEIEDRERLSLICRLHGLATEHHYLVHLKKKYADGEQKIAYRICRQINSTTLAIRRACMVYNSFTSKSAVLPGRIDITQAKQPTSALYDHLICTYESYDRFVPSKLQRSIMDAFSLQQRASEEIALVKEEMRSIYKFYCNQYDIYQSSCSTLREKLVSSRLDKGKLCMLSCKVHSLTSFIQYLYSLFSPFVTGIHLPPISRTSGDDEDLIGKVEYASSISSTESELSDLSDSEVI